MNAVENNVKEILDTQVNECAWLDYKVMWYEHNAQLLKDIVSMLNSNEAYDKDKFLIIGVNDEKKLVGLAKNIPDDNEIQNLMKNINPRPQISSGMIMYNDKNIGFIFISKNNHERIYEINSNIYNMNYFSQKYDYINEQNLNAIVKNIIKYCKFKGQSFIRKGSTNCFITDEERKKFILNQ